MRLASGRLLGLLNVNSVIALSMFNGRMQSFNSVLECIDGI